MKRLREIIGYVMGGVLFVGLLPLIMWLASGMPDMATHIGATGTTDTSLLIISILTTGILIIGGLSLSVWTIVYMKQKGRGNPMDAFGHEVAPRTQHLMTDGPYRLNRNPMLSGTLAYLAGFVTWLWTWQAAAVWATFFAIMLVQVLTEEKRLRKDFGSEYEDYCKRTRRF